MQAGARSHGLVRDRVPASDASVREADLRDDVALSHVAPEVGDDAGACAKNPR
jgi:hypothetical protein